jgi:hypothetical protein
VADLIPATAVSPLFDVNAVARAAMVNQARAELLESGTAVTVAQFAEATHRTVDTARKWATRQRDKSQLVIVHLSDGTLLIPTIQLDEAFDLNKQVADRTQRLVEWGMGPWALWGWWQTLNGWLDGTSPAEEARAGRFDEVDRAVDGLLQ